MGLGALEPVALGVALIEQPHDYIGERFTLLSCGDAQASALVIGHSHDDRRLSFAARTTALAPHWNHAYQYIPKR
jgi:hypothetical protein